MEFLKSCTGMHFQPFIGTAISAIDVFFIENFLRNDSYQLALVIKKLGQ